MSGPRRWPTVAIAQSWSGSTAAASPRAAARRRAYDGTRLARRGDVVVVTVNHRLNIFGYLALDHYGEGFEDSSVAGVLDMIQALEWVKSNHPELRRRSRHRDDLRRVWRRAPRSRR